MNSIRRLSTARLAALVAVLAALAVGATVAIAARGDSPPKKALPNAVADSLAGGRPAGLVADVRFTSRLLDDALPAAAAFLGRAEGRVWLADDGRFRVRLDTPFGAMQAASDGRTLSAYLPMTNTVYRVAMPAGHAGERGEAGGAPSTAAIERLIEKVRGKANVAGPTSTTVAGRPAYVVRISPQHDAGLLGSLELAWDAERAVPLRAAVLAAGQEEPVLELAATDVRYGAVPADQLVLQAPDGARVVELDPERIGRKAAEAAAGAREAIGATGEAAVRRALPFRLAAPDRLVGLPRAGVRELRLGESPAALVTYGEGLGAVAVLQWSGDMPALDAVRLLPQVQIAGATGLELATPLGTALVVQRDGVSYALLGSLPAAAAEAAARSLVR